MAEQKSVCESKHFETIFNGQAEALRNFVYYKCGNLQQAEDIVQESFLKAYQKLPSFQFRSAFKSYF